MKEIGGYLGLEQFVHHEYYSNLISLNNARNALLYILKARTIRKLYIPYFLCDSVSELCDREGYSYEFYHIDNCFQPIFEQTLSPNEYLYIVNYYGQIDNSQIAALKDRYQRIIIDNTGHPANCAARNYPTPMLSPVEIKQHSFGLRKFICIGRATGKSVFRFPAVNEHDSASCKGTSS